MCRKALKHEASHFREKKKEMKFCMVRRIIWKMLILGGHTGKCLRKQHIGGRDGLWSQAGPVSDSSLTQSFVLCEPWPVVCKVGLPYYTGHSESVKVLHHVLRTGHRQGPQRTHHQ